MLVVFLAFLLGITIWAVWSVFRDLQIRDQTPHPVPPPEPQEESWPPPPKL